MFISSSISNNLDFSSVNHISRNEKSELNIFKNISFLVEFLINERTIFLEQMYTRLFNLAENRC